jgi:single-strand DNA-binding protein
VPSYNRLTLVGNLTRDPEIRYVQQGGKAVTKFSLAVNRKTRGNDEVLFIDVVAWEKLGEICNQYLKKGMCVLVTGRLSIRDYTANDGGKRKAVECVAIDMQMLDGKKREGGGSSARGYTAEDFEDGYDDEVPF